MASHPNVTECKKFWADFLLLYRNLPALWKVKSPEYRDRNLKRKCYDKLVQKLREIDPNANQKMVVKKINTFRGNFRREHNKILQTQQSDMPYISNLWYYELLEFLYGELRCRGKRRKHEIYDDEDEELHLTEDDDDEQYDDDEEDFATYCDRDVVKHGTSEQHGRGGTANDIECVLINGEHLEQAEYLDGNEMKPTLLELQTEHAQYNYAPATKKRRLGRTKPESNSDDDDNDSGAVNSIDDLSPMRREQQTASILARSWESQYNELSGRQKILARKMISDILYFGCLGQLNEVQAERLQKLFHMYSAAHNGMQ